MYCNIIIFINILIIFFLMLIMLTPPGNTGLILFSTETTAINDTIFVVIIVTIGILCILRTRIRTTYYVPESLKKKDLEEEFEHRSNQIESKPSEPWTPAEKERLIKIICGLYLFITIGVSLYCLIYHSNYCPSLEEIQKVTGHSPNDASPGIHWDMLSAANTATCRELETNLTNWYNDYILRETARNIYEANYWCELFEDPFSFKLDLEDLKKIFKK